MITRAWAARNSKRMMNMWMREARSTKGNSVIYVYHEEREERSRRQCSAPDDIDRLPIHSRECTNTNIWLYTTQYTITRIAALSSANKPDPRLPTRPYESRPVRWLTTPPQTRSLGSTCIT
jgi:hypothetical protein